MSRFTIAADAFPPVQPPAPLRARVLDRHARRRLARRAAPGLVAVLALALGAALLHGPTGRDDGASWQARSRALEDAWRASGDAAWLRDDARARPLLYRLQRVDASIARTLADTRPAEPDQLDRLWRERSEVLAALVESRQQGGVAVVL